eukprot:959108-Pyramimonas_sp.AAC.1
MASPGRNWQQCAGGRRRQRPCGSLRVTTLLDLVTPNRDPAHRLPSETLRMWIRAWISEPH